MTDTYPRAKFAQAPEESAVAFVAHVAELGAIDPGENAAEMIEEDYESAVAAIEELQSLILWAKRIQAAGIASEQA